MERLLLYRLSISPTQNLFTDKIFYLVGPCTSEAMLEAGMLTAGKSYRLATQPHGKSSPKYSEVKRSCIWCKGEENGL